MKERFQRLRDVAVEEALLAKAFLAGLIKKHETTNEERSEMAKNPKPVVEWILDFGKSVRAMYFRTLEGDLAKKLKETQVSDDVEELLDADDDATTTRIESVWQKVLGKVRPNEVVAEWLKLSVIKERVTKRPEFLDAAQEYAEQHLRYLFARILNREPVEDEKKEKAENSKESDS
ncbi:hypothetical protein JXD20_00155 [Candidatus Peregrinibacteria bacterium]|nr:hypothetical protein [Candidatus Peregrinibacteria bacterium]